MELNIISPETIREYLTRNFISLEQLTKESNLTENQIRSLVAQKCIPSPSYTLTQTHEVHSNLSSRVEDIGQLTKEFFARSTVSWLLNLTHKEALADLATQLYQKFEAEYQSSIFKRSAKDFGFGDLFEGDEIIPSRLRSCATGDWDNLLKGIYGICIKGPISADSIVRKAVAVYKVSEITDNGAARSIAESEKHDLVSAMKEFDSIVSNFAPHDWSTSSRKRLFDDLVPRFGLETEFPNFRVDASSL